MLIKKSSTAGTATKGKLSGILAGAAIQTMDRRGFLKASGLAAGGLAAVSALSPAMVKQAQAAPSVSSNIVKRRNMCTHCSVGCTVTAEVENGVWVGQEPSWDSPINRGSHCAKGASVRELVSGERRLKYPMKLTGGKWNRVSWDVAMKEIGEKLGAIRQKSGSDSVYWLGSAKMTDEGSYLFRKLGAFWGTNNTDHQARICHSTTVTGVANTWGYGAVTNSYTDIRNSKTQIIMGGNPEKLIKLWREKREEAEPDDLSDILAVQMGSFTEPFNAAWFEKQTGETIEGRGDIAQHPKHDFMRCTLDGRVIDAFGMRYVWEAKHCGVRSTDAEIFERYVPQLTHNTLCDGACGAYLSAFKGNGDWIMFQYDLDQTYADALIEAETRFWECVRTGEPPAPLPLPPAPKPKGVVEYSMAESNAWASYAADYLETEMAADRHDIAKKALKELVPADASKCFGHGLVINRDKRGALRFAKES